MSTKDYAGAAQAIRRMAMQYQAMVDAADILEQVGPPAQALDEINRELAAAREQLTAIYVEQQQVTTNLTQARTHADDVLRQANAEAGVIAQRAGDEANKIVAEAREAAADLTGKANAAAATAVERAMLEASDNIAALKRETADAITQRNMAAAERDAAQAQLNQINGLLAEAKAKIASLSNL